jgi:hypothetical protein
MEKLKLTPNRPEVIALAFTAGKPVSSNFTGDQMMYTLTDGRLWFADLEAAAKVDALNLGRGEPCEVTMCMDRAKNKSYEVRYVDGATAPATQAPQAPTRQRVEALTSGTAAQVAQVHPQYNAPAPNSTGGALMGCFMSAIDAIVEAQAYVTRRGLAITFTAEDVRSTAISAYIGLQKGGR